MIIYYGSHTLLTVWTEILKNIPHDESCDLWSVGTFFK
jgi:hypothetical protein